MKKAEGVITNAELLTLPCNLPVRNSKFLIAGGQDPITTRRSSGQKRRNVLRNPQFQPRNSEIFAT